MTTAPACPKAMTYGPCGGVQPDGTCEVAPTPCVFLDGPLPTWSGPAARATPRIGRGEAMLARAQAGRLVITGLPARAMDSASLRATARELLGSVDAVLMGDSGRERVQYPPSYRARLVQDEGLVAWPGITCRDRNRVALEGELAALADIGVGGVHCVTGDHTASGHRPDAAPVFDLDSPRLVAIAHAVGLATSVAESPASPPVTQRAARVAMKAQAGADLCMLQYAGEVADVAAFVAQVCAVAPGVGVLPGVPVLTDVAGARLLSSFAAAVLPAGYAERVLAAADPYETGIAAAAALGRELLAIDGVAGVVLAGGPAPGTELAFARALARVAEQLRD
jgi:methylenetetrahydrofolate reductase (NADPH)